MTKAAKNKALTAHDIFVPSSFPEHTYVARGGDDLEEKLPTTRVLTWDERDQILEIPDPYLSFYLRWSDRLRQVD